MLPQVELMVGFAYSGPNAAHTHHLEKGIKWQKFLTEPKNLRVEDATMPIQDYPYVLQQVSAD